MNIAAKFPRRAERYPGGDDVAASPMDRHVPRGRLRRTHVIATGVGVLLLTVGGYAYMNFGRQSSIAIPVDRVTISSVQRAPFSDYVPVTGTVVPMTSIFIDAVEGGQVTEVLVEEGAWVEAGQPLARLKNAQLELEVLAQEAQVAERQNDVASARLKFDQDELKNRRDRMLTALEIRKRSDLLDRRRNLAGSAFPAAEIADLERELDYYRELLAVMEESHAQERQLALDNLRQSQESVDRMAQTMELVRRSLDNLNLVAPSTGQLTTFDLNVGAVLAAGQRIGQVDAVDSFKISALVDEFYLGRVAKGQSATVEVAGRTAELEVAKIYPNVQDQQFQVDMTFVGPPPDGLRRGQTLRPRIELGETEDSLVLPNGPYVDDTGGIWVFVVSPGGASATRQSVHLGRRNPDMVEVLQGLNEGDRVVVSTYQAFHDFERIDFN